MIILPAIDLKDGNCVRLVQGKMDTANIYSNDAVKIAKYFEDIGSDYIHIIDLDGAFSGSPKNKEVIEEIVDTVSIPIEVGGGIRDIETVKDYLDSGVSRIIIGTQAIENPEFLKELLNTYGDKIAVSLDCKDDYVATKGWTEVSEEKVFDKAKELENQGLKTLIYTDISRDGMLTEPNYGVLEELNKLGLNIIASGGASSEAQLDNLKALDLYGAIIGKAIYTDKINLEEYLKNNAS